VESFDVSTKTWQSEKDLPSTHCSSAYIVHNNTFYVGGGLSLQGPSNSVDVVSFK
jgi:hypothetical protein